MARPCSASPQCVPMPAGHRWAPCAAEQPAGHCGPGRAALQEKQLHQCRTCLWCFTRSCHITLADLVFYETAVAKAEPHCYPARQKAAVQGCLCNDRLNQSLTGLPAAPPAFLLVFTIASANRRLPALMDFDSIC